MWTDDQVGTLKRLWGDGYSASLIGLQIGYTRNAVLGKVFRLGLEKRPERIRPAIHRPSSPRPRRQRDAYEMERIREKQRERYNERRAARAGEQKAYLSRCKAPKTSAEYRNHLPIMPDMSKTELRAMLAAAVMNTAAMEQA